MKMLFRRFLYIILFSINGACFAASPNLTTIPSATQITDSQGGVWTVGGGGLCYLNGAQAGGCSNVNTLLWSGGGIYVYNTLGQWYQWNKGSWGQVAQDPRTAVPASGATIPPGTQLTELEWRRLDSRRRRPLLPQRSSGRRM